MYACFSMIKVSSSTYLDTFNPMRELKKPPPDEDSVIPKLTVALRICAIVCIGPSISPSVMPDGLEDESPSLYITASRSFDSSAKFSDCKNIMKSGSLCKTFLLEILRSICSNANLLFSMNLSSKRPYTCFSGGGGIM